MCSITKHYHDKNVQNRSDRALEYYKVFLKTRSPSCKKYQEKIKISFIAFISAVVCLNCCISQNVSCFLCYQISRGQYASNSYKTAKRKEVLKSQKRFDGIYITIYLFLHFFNWKLIVFLYYLKKKVLTASFLFILQNLAVKRTRKNPFLLLLKMTPKAPGRSKNLSTDWQKHKQQSRNPLIRTDNMQNPNQTLWHSMGIIAPVKQRIMFQGKIKLSLEATLWKEDTQNSVQVQSLREQKRSLKVGSMKSLPRGASPN